MKALDAIKTMISNSGVSIRGLGALLDKSEFYINGIIYRGSVPKVDTTARIADACGYDLILRRRDDGDEILITDDE